MSEGESERTSNAAAKRLPQFFTVLSRLRLLSLCLAALLLLCLSGSNRATAHKYHFSFTQLEYNSQEKATEIILRVFADDLETAISKRSGKSIKLDNKEATAMVTEYVRDKIELKGRDGRAKKLTWVGMEPKVDVVFLYLEAKAPEGVIGAQFRQQMFFDLFEDQVNQVLFKVDPHKASVDFKQGDGFKTISFLAK